MQRMWTDGVSRLDWVSAEDQNEVNLRNKLQGCFTTPNLAHTAAALSKNGHRLAGEPEPGIRSVAEDRSFRHGYSTMVERLNDSTSESPRTTAVVTGERHRDGAPGNEDSDTGQHPPAGDRQRLGLLDKRQRLVPGVRPSTPRRRSRRYPCAVESCAGAALRRSVARPPSLPRRTSRSWPSRYRRDRSEPTRGLVKM